MLRRFVTGFFLLSICTISGPARAQTAAARAQEQAKPAAAAVPAKNDYSNPDFWLCRPGRQDACAIDLTTTVVAADGKLTRETWAVNPNAPIDGFYVYPTVSNDPSPNSDMIPGVEEKRVIEAQFARSLTTMCSMPGITTSRTTIRVAEWS